MVDHLFTGITKYDVNSIISSRLNVKHEIERNEQQREQGGKESIRKQRRRYAEKILEGARINLKSFIDSSERYSFPQITSYVKVNIK